MAELINLTPHDLHIYEYYNIHDEEGNLGWTLVETIPSSGIVRVSEEEKQVDTINGYPLVKKVYGACNGLPEPKKDTYYIVSLLTAQVAKRKDLLIVGQTVREDNDGNISAEKNARGRIIGCTSFAIVL